MRVTSYSWHISCAWHWIRVSGIRRWRCVSIERSETSNTGFQYATRMLYLSKNWMSYLSKLSAVNWARTREEAVRHAHFPEGHREAWIKLFIRYNTALPSSAAAERLFSTSSGILRPRRSSVTASNFEQLVLLKGNSRLFRAALKEEF